MNDHLVPLYESFAQRLNAEPTMGIEGMRDLFEGWQAGTAETESVVYSEAQDSPVPGTWCVPIATESNKAIVYTHGGGFVVGSRSSHRKLAGHLAARSGIPVLVIDYRRAPEHPFPAQLEDDTAVVEWLLADGRRPSDIVLAGDSAGGNIAIGTALRLAHMGMSPGAVVAFSPWLDMEQIGASMDANVAHDAMVSRPMLQVMTAMYLAGEASTSPEANPLYADTAAMPPVFLAASGHETLRDDAVRFAERVRSRGGGPVRLDIAPRQQHVYQMGAGRSKVADESLAEVGRWLQATLKSSLATGAKMPEAVS